MFQYTAKKSACKMFGKCRYDAISMFLEELQYVVSIQAIVIDTQWEFSYAYPIKNNL